MPVLLVVNGPPAAGKSTIATMYVARHPLALRIDVDQIRDLLGAWQDEPDAAGLRARALATAMARDHLEAGRDVVVAQLYGRVEHLDELRSLAAEVGAHYREVVLTVDRAETLERFVRRGGPRLDEALRTAAGLDAVAALHARVDAVRRDRPWVIPIASIHGDPDATYAAMVASLALRS